MTWRDAGQVIQINILPDDVLLEIFYFHVGTSQSYAYGDKMGIQAWQSLVHVCRRWRTLVLGSPRQLNLRLVCTPFTPARDKLDIWPALPLIISGSMAFLDMNNIIAALGQSTRVCQVDLSGLVDRQIEQVLAAMQVPFPELTNLRLWPDDETQPPPVIPIPDSFLGGSAPRLQYFELSSILFPELPNLLLSATHLVRLLLSDIPHSGYISPEAIVAVLSVLSNLEIFSLEFRSPQSRPDLERRSLLPPKRSILTALNDFNFKGVTEYLEDLLTFIDVPQLDYMEIAFFNQVDFDCPRLAQFINRTPTLRVHDKAHVDFEDWGTSFALSTRPGALAISILCTEPDWQLSSIEQVCNISLQVLSKVEDLYIRHHYFEQVWMNDAIENTLWLQLLLPFTAVRNLYLSKEFAPGIEAALHELVGGRVTEVLPSLQTIFVKGLGLLGPFEENIGQFVATRLHSGHPIAISAWGEPAYNEEGEEEESAFQAKLKRVFGSIGAKFGFPLRLKGKRIAKGPNAVWI